jgi:hypothetical protein
MEGYSVIQTPIGLIRIVAASEAENFQKQYNAVILHTCNTYEQAEIWISQKDDLEGVNND